MWSREQRNVRRNLPKRDFAFQVGGAFPDTVHVREALERVRGSGRCATLRSFACVSGYVASQSSGGHAGGTAPIEVMRATACSKRIVRSRPLLRPVVLPLVCIRQLAGGVARSRRPAVRTRVPDSRTRMSDGLPAQAMDAAPAAKRPRIEHSDEGEAAADGSAVMADDATAVVGAAAVTVAGGAAAGGAGALVAAAGAGAGAGGMRDVDYLLDRATPFGNETCELASGEFVPGAAVSAAWEGGGAGGSFRVTCHRGPSRRRVRLSQRPAFSSSALAAWAAR
jgi:hypothetical protein